MGSGLAGAWRTARSILALMAVSTALTVSSPLLLPQNSAPAADLALPVENAVPGGVKILRLDAAERTRCPTSTRTGIARWWFGTIRPGLVAVIGIPLSAPLGTRQVIVRGTDGRQEIEFSVGDKRYISQSLKVAPRQVDLQSAADLARIQTEKRSASIMR